MNQRRVSAYKFWVSCLSGRVISPTNKIWLKSWTLLVQKPHPFNFGFDRNFENLNIKLVIFAQIKYLKAAIFHIFLEKVSST